ncbi:MAG: hypothetical protein WCW17_01190 [Patescibacteria group bacterium]
MKNNFDRMALRNLAISNYPNFWKNQQKQLDHIIDELIFEMQKNEATDIKLKIDQFLNTKSRIKAIWVLAGSGTYLKPLTDSPSDRQNLGNEWYHNLDKERLNFAAEIINNISKLRDNAPMLIYNGIDIQNKDLLKAARAQKFPIAKDNIFIPKGKIIRTLDQINFFNFPGNFELKKGDFLGIVSHTPHLSRVLRIMSKHKNRFKGINLVLLPINIKNVEGEKKLTEAEITGILDYIAQDLANIEPYPYK